MFTHIALPTNSIRAVIVSMIWQLVWVVFLFYFRPQMAHDKTTAFLECDAITHRRIAGFRRCPGHSRSYRCSRGNLGRTGSFRCIARTPSDTATCSLHRCMQLLSNQIKSSDGFRGGRAGSAHPHPHLDDGLTPSLTVMSANAKFWSLYCKTWYSE